MIKIEVNTESKNGAVRAVKVEGKVIGKGKDLIPECVTVLRTLEAKLDKELFAVALNDWLEDNIEEIAQIELDKGADNDVSNK